MSVYQLLYVSGASGAVTEAEIEQILSSSRRNNAALGVTGMLLYSDGAFIQVLEGDEKTVKALARRISHDRRHRNYMVLCEQFAEERAFADWQMGFKRLDPQRAGDRAVFEATRPALEGRIATGDGGIMLETVTAFSRDFLRAA
ncbi:BLUF domain protein [Chelativorans sp. ZYF759]|uniref:BLUF domain-containing protein n=1 Tax=Chelativorans sp. ZYF759 TaxID=2692213 RepID=UPI00145D1A24|nr:BLUF domain-containing protein [Chelativorans sp. ZYF759]NMG39552.1 BLUF domain protein [Chelativorans sp. ZYF759]